MDVISWVSIMVWVDDRLIHHTRPRTHTPHTDLIPFGNHPLYRYTLGWLGAPKVSFIKKTMTPQIRREVVYKHVVQVSQVDDDQTNAPNRPTHTRTTGG